MMTVDSAGNMNIQLLGIEFPVCDLQQLLEAIKAAVEADRRAIILSGNVHAFNLAYEQPWLKDYFNRADIVRVDGAGVQLGARLLGHNLPDRMTWADFAWSLAGFCAERDFSLFFLGARQGVADKAADRLREKFPDLDIGGIHHGFFDKTPGSLENEAVILQINKIKPHILVVGFGMPLQEQWLMENWDHIDANVALTGRAVFDYVSGELHRAPRWMTDNNLEWLGRLLIEPHRLWKRYLVGNPLFLWRVLKQRMGLLSFD